MEITAAASAVSLPLPAAPVSAVPPATNGATAGGATPNSNTASNVTTAAVSGTQSKAKGNNSDQQNSPTSQKALDDSLSKINQTVQLFNNTIEFQVDPTTNRQVVRIVDTQTKEVVSQIPSEEALQLAQALEKLQGLLVKDKA